MLKKLKEVLSCSPTGEMAPLDKLQLRLKPFPDHSIGWIGVENNDLKNILRTKCLVLCKEGAPDIILAHGSGATNEEAEQICAQSFLPHFNKLRDFLPSVAHEQIEEADK